MKMTCIGFSGLDKVVCNHYMQSIEAKKSFYCNLSTSFLQPFAVASLARNRLAHIDRALEMVYIEKNKGS